MSVEDQNSKDSAFIAASQSDQQINTAKAGILKRLIIVPSAVAAGAVSYKDGSAGSARSVYAGGTIGADLTPIVIELDVRGAGVDGFHITTGANISVIATGKFNSL